ncbi:AAA family ATPase [Thermus sp.]|uniref:AAA family ATPase n=1 Tax=Thermus sp. TaxID=275 RepID=UPI003D0D53C3
MDPSGAVYVDFDAATGDGRAVRGWIERHKAAYPDGDVGRLVVLEPEGDTYGLGEEELAELERVVKEAGAGLVIVDSFMAAFPLDVVKAHQVQAAFYHLRRLALTTGSAVVVIDHLPKPMSGEQAGARGLLGSIAKTAQARSVHILTRVPPKEVEGRHVLRWDVLKNSFAPVPEPFGVELVFEPGLVRVVEAALPEGSVNPRKAKAQAVVLTLLQGGGVVPRKDLVEAIIREANVHRKTAERYLAEIAQEAGLVVATIPGKGNPVAYRLPEATPLPGEVGPSQSATLSAPATPKSENPDAHRERFRSTPLLLNGEGAPKSPSTSTRRGLFRGVVSLRDTADTGREVQDRETGEEGELL